MRLSHRGRNSQPFVGMMGIGTLRGCLRTLERHVERARSSCQESEPERVDTARATGKCWTPKKHGSAGRHFYTAWLEENLSQIPTETPEHKVIQGDVSVSKV